MIKHLKFLSKLLFISLIVIFIIFISIDINSEDVILNEFIEVEIKGEVENPGVYTLKNGSTINDLFVLAIPKDDSDISAYSLQNVLYNKQLIIINKQKQEELISINTATLKQLCTLPGIGETIAQRIIDYREYVGSFLKIEDLMQVKGIGQNKFNKIKQYITL